MCLKRCSMTHSLQKIIPGRRTAVYLHATSSQCHPTLEMQLEQGALGVQMLAASNKLWTVWETDCKYQLRIM